MVLYERIALMFTEFPKNPLFGMLYSGLSYDFRETCVISKYLAKSIKFSRKAPGESAVDATFGKVFGPAHTEKFSR